MNIQILAKDPQLSTSALRSLLNREFSQNDSPIEVKPRQTPVRFRGVDPTISIALVGSGGAVLGALIAGLLRIAGHIKSKTILLQGRSGRKIEFPADTPVDHIEKLIQMAEELDVERIEL